MPTLTEGANAALDATSLTAAVSGSVDVTALVVSVDGKVASDADMVFFNQPVAPGVLLKDTTLHLDLNALRHGADKVVLVVSPAQDGVTFHGLPLSLVIRHGGEDLHFIPANLNNQTVTVLAEVYHRAGTWKVRAIGQGYDNGLAGLATDFGVQIDNSGLDEPHDREDPHEPSEARIPEPPGDEKPTKQDPPPAAVTPPVQPPVASSLATPSRATPSFPTTGAPPLQLTKPPLGAVNLQKNERVSLAKAPHTHITADLKWTKRKDLDLYALYIDTDNREGVCYYRKPGDLMKPPYLSLTSGDSREPGLETIEITRPDRLRHVLICAYSAVENGFGSFRSFGAHVEVNDHAGSVVTSPLYHRNAFAYWVAIAHIDLTPPTEVAITHVETYSKGGNERRPLLHPDGTFEMGKGPVEFKSKLLQRLAERQNRQR